MPNKKYNVHDWVKEFNTHNYYEIINIDKRKHLYTLSCVIMDNELYYPVHNITIDYTELTTNFKLANVAKILYDK